MRISTHTSRVGCDFVERYNRLIEQDFYSHIPCGMWLISGAAQNSGGITFLLTHPVWDVTWEMCLYMRLIGISTHTSRVGCDHRKGEVNLLGKFLLTHPVWDVTQTNAYALWYNRISTHTSRVGCDNDDGERYTVLLVFLLTHPVWDVTADGNEYEIEVEISTHTSRVGCDRYI